jgi:hypothetical protein
MFKRPHSHRTLLKSQSVDKSKKNNEENSLM